MVIWVILYLLKCIINYKNNIYSKQLNDYKDEKDHNINEFFQKIGPVLTEEVSNYVKSKTSYDIEIYKNAIDEKEKEIEGLTKERIFLVTKSDAYVKLTQDLSKFVWCKDCGALGRGFRIKKKRESGERTSVLSYDNVNADVLNKKFGGKNEKLGLEGLHAEEDEKKKEFNELKEDKGDLLMNMRKVSMSHDDIGVIDTGTGCTSGSCEDDMCENTPPRCQENCLQRYFKYCAKAGKDFKRRMNIN